MDPSFVIGIGIGVILVVLFAGNICDVLVELMEMLGRLPGTIFGRKIASPPPDRRVWQLPSTTFDATRIQKGSGNKRSN